MTDRDRFKAKMRSMVQLAEETERLFDGKPEDVRQIKVNLADLQSRLLSLMKIADRAIRNKHCETCKWCVRPEGTDFTVCWIPFKNRGKTVATVTRIDPEDDACIEYEVEE